MPLYEYKCGNCGKHFEVIQKFSDEPLKMHPECNGGPVEKILSAPAIQFKGSGWYVTDYGKGKDKGNGASGEKKSESKTESKSESTSSTSESKPASTTTNTDAKPPR